MKDGFQHLFVKLGMQWLFIVLLRRGIYDFQQSYASLILSLLEGEGRRRKNESELGQKPHTQSSTASWHFILLFLLESVS